MNWELLILIMGTILFVWAVGRIVVTFQQFRKLSSFEQDIIRIRLGKEVFIFITYIICMLVYIFGGN